MPKYLIINNNIVSNTIEAPNLQVASTLNPGAQEILEVTPLLSNIGIGFEYTGAGAVPFITPTQIGGPPVVNTPWTWFIDVGPFFDRFGAFKLPILINPDPGIKALITDLQVRKWVDLQNNEVSGGLAYISTIIPTFTSDIRLQILTTPVTLEENRALRTLYFN